MRGLRKPGAMSRLAILREISPGNEQEWPVDESTACGFRLAGKTQERQNCHPGRGWRTQNAITFNIKKNYFVKF